jgi:hypothetical protein
LFPPVFARVNVAFYVLIFDVADVVSLRGALYYGCSHPELFDRNLDLFSLVIFLRFTADFALFLPSGMRVTLGTLGPEVNNGG